jgi:hypothetical protein
MAERKNQLEDQQIDAIEGRLAGTLKRVTPPEDFVTRLGSHIRVPQRDAIVVRLHEWEHLLVVVGGVLSGAVAVLTLARAMYYLFGRKG